MISLSLVSLTFLSPIKLIFDIFVLLFFVIRKYKFTLSLSKFSILVEISAKLNPRFW